MKNKTLFFSLLFLILSCHKLPDPPADPTPVYSGILYRVTYITFNGTTTIDTLDLNFQVQLTAQSNGVLLQADKPELDSIFMPKQGPFDSTSAHFGNAEVFILDLPNTQNLVYNLYLNPSANGADSMMLRYYPPPMGGWNQTTFFKGVR